MTLKIRIIIIVFMLIFMAVIIKKLHTRLMEYKFGIIWIIGSIAVCLMAIFPRIPAFLSELTGVETPVNLLFFLGFLLSFYIIFQMGVHISKLDNQIKILTQEIGILEAKQNKETKDSHEH